MGKLWVVVDQLTLQFPSADSPDTRSKHRRTSSNKGRLQTAHKTPKAAFEVGYKTTKVVCKVGYKATKADRLLWRLMSPVSSKKSALEHNRETSSAPA